MKENDIIERLHKAYDVKEPDVLSKLNFSQVEMVPPPEKNLKKRYLSAVAIYAAACLVVAVLLPFLIGRGGNDDPKPQPGVSPVGTETIESRTDTEKNPEYTEYNTVTATQSDYVTSEAETENNTLIIPPEPPISIDVYPIPVEPSETEPAVVTTEPPTPPEETTTTTGQRFDPVGTSATTKKPNPAPKMYADPAGAVRAYFYKDIDHTQKYPSAEDIPYGAKVYYEIETDPGYICTNFSINVYKSSFNVDLVSNDACKSTVDYFINNYHGEYLDYSLTAVLAGDSNGNLTYDMDDVETIRKYIEGDTTTRWLYGRYGYSEKLDYDCSGGINENDVSGVLSEIENGYAERNTMASNRYCNSYIGTRSRLLDLDNAVLLPHGMNPKYIEYDCNVYKDVSYMNGFSEEVKEKYDDHFFISHDLIVIYCYTENGEIPTVSELYDVWITGNSTSAYINPVYSDDNAGQTLSDYAIFIPISANVRLQDNAPM